MSTQSISVKVHPGAKKELLISYGPQRFEAWVRARPHDGDANDAVASLIAKSLGIAPSAVRLVKGWSGRHKVFRLLL